MSQVETGREMSKSLSEVRTWSDISTREGNVKIPPRSQNME